MKTDPVTSFKNNVSLDGGFVKKFLPKFCPLCGEGIIFFEDGFSCKHFVSSDLNLFCPYAY